MRPFLALLLFSVVMLAIVPFVGTADAMSAFSRKYGMKCDSCHRQRIPELNDFGVEFYRNGFTLPGRDGSAKKASPDSVPETQMPVKEGGGSGEGGGKTAPSRGAAQGGTVPAAEEDESEEEVAEEAPPPVPTVVYRLPSRDGSVYFTDNPVRRDDIPSAGKKQGRRPVALRGPVLRPAREPKRPVVSAMPRMQSAGSAPARKERFGSYGECMERSLLEGPSPGSAEDIMARLTEAEKRCSAYQPTGR